MADVDDIEFMKQALDLAYKGNGATSPNPMVGAVIVKDRRIISRGFHRKAGTDHAEIVALKKAGKTASGATLYVTLEPCCHHGKTGPCTDAIIAAGIRRVVYAVKDPNPDVDGKGAARLKRAGITVQSGVLRDEAKRLNEKYFGYLTNKRPFVILKTAQTIDGRIATATGDSQWISSPESLAFAHKLRAEVDGVVVGMGTVRVDNPSLTVRHAKGENPYRIIVAGSPKVPRKCALLNRNGDERTIVAGSEQAIDRLTRTRKNGDLTCWRVNMRRDGLVDLRDLLNKADEFGLRSLLVEGGGRLATSFLMRGLVDKYVAIIAPIVLGEGVSAVGDLRIRRLTKALKFERQSFIPSGRDMIFVGYPVRGK
jgi:diaminohydroxyphosphoribosylaminopyrimidine deaminase/5-amino-6-(5-phosphoribosylamino)uracil reductase